MAFCPRCGIEIGGSLCASCDAEGGGPGGTVQPAAPAKKVRNSGLSLVLSLTACLAMVSTAVGISGCESSHLPGGKDCLNNSKSYLEMLQREDAAAPRLWKSGVHPVPLFAVLDYTRTEQGEMLQHNGKPFPIARVYYQYAVQSSTQDGVRIRRRWNIALEPSSPNLNGSTCAIVAMEQAQ